jgi:hypothetical protein
LQGTCKILSMCNQQALRVWLLQLHIDCSQHLALECHCNNVTLTPTLALKRQAYDREISISHFATLSP